MDTNQTIANVSSFCVLPQEITDYQWAFYRDFLWWLEGFGSVVIGFVGIFFNLITILVLLGSELAASFFNWLLVSLAVFDVLILLNGILEAFRNHIGSSNVHDYIFVTFLYPFRSVVMCCSIYTTVMLALERYNALARPTSGQGHRLGNYPQSLKQYFNVHFRRLFKYIGPIIILSVFFNIPKRLELEGSYQSRCNDTSNKHFNDTLATEIFQERTNNSNECSKYEYGIALTGLRSNNYYNLWYQNISNLLVTAVIPLISLTYLNVNIYLKFKQYLERQPRATTTSSNVPTASHIQKKFKQREKDMIQQTMILFSVVILFGLFHILRIILNVEEFSSLDNRKNAKQQGCEWLQYWTIIASPVSSLLLQLNSSFNFIIYCFFNKPFREKLITLITAVTKLLKFRCCGNIEQESSTEQLTLPASNNTKMASLPNDNGAAKINLKRIDSADQSCSNDGISTSAIV